MTDLTAYRPADEAEVCTIIADAAADGRRLRIRGGGSKDAVGASSDAAVLDMTAFTGVLDYDPPELVLTVRAGTPLSEVQALLAENRQMLAFAPWDPACLFGGEAGNATIGGTVAAGISGSQRLTQGAARDHLLGFTAVSGRGEKFIAGAKVVKNVTGYDLSKLMAGSWGRLVALTELTLKVLPLPETSITVVAEGLSAGQAWQAMAHCLQSDAEVAAAAHVPAGVLGACALTAMRLQGFDASVQARAQMLEEIEHIDWRFGRMQQEDADALWGLMQTLSCLGGADAPLWRVSLPARQAPAFLDRVKAADGEWLMDWGGALVWLAGERDAGELRAAAQALGGHAMLMRGPQALRDAVPAFHPQPEGVAFIEERVRRAFDPAGVFETGRF